MTKKKFIQLDAFNVVASTLMLIFAVLCIYPLWYVIVGSFNQGTDYIKGGVFIWPRIFSTDNYAFVLADDRLFIGYRVTLIRTFVGTITSVLFTSIVAYAMSRRDLPLRNQIYWFSLFTMFFGGGLVPFYLVLKTLGLTNTMSVYIIPSLYNVFNMIIIMNYFRDVPEEMHESGLMDGAGDFRIFSSIYLPLAKPILATIALWNAVGHWNSYFDSMVYTTSPELQTLQFFLVKLIKEANLSASSSLVALPAEITRTTVVATVRFAAMVLSVIPILLVYPFVQKFLQKGIMLGSLKG